MVSIRRYGQADRNILRNLVLQLHETLRPLDVDLAPGDEIIERYFNDLVSRIGQSAGAIFVAEDAKRIIGYVCLWGSMTPDDLDERPAPYSFMAELFVQPDYRSLGIGRRLVAHAERHALACGSHKIELKVLAENASALRFYEALGYEPRMLIMRKQLRPAGD